LLCDGFSFDGKRIEETSLHAQTLAILAWREIVYEPVFDGLFNKTIVPTSHGKIRSSWKRSVSRIDVRLNLPKGVSAKVILPNQKPFKVSGSSSWRIEL